jgi:hypothetical protein
VRRGHTRHELLLVARLHRLEDRRRARDLVLARGLVDVDRRSPSGRRRGLRLRAYSPGGRGDDRGDVAGMRSGEQETSAAEARGPHDNGSAGRPSGFPTRVPLRDRATRCRSFARARPGAAAVRLVPPRRSPERWSIARTVKPAFTSRGASARTRWRSIRPDGKRRRSAPSRRPRARRRRGP